MDAVRLRTQRMLVDYMGSVRVNRAGNYFFDHESIRVHVGFTTFGEDKPVVRVFSYTNWDVPPSPDLFRFVATQAYRYTFGALSAHETDGGLVEVMFSHSLLGEYLDPDELQTTIVAISGTGDDLDSEIQQRFGGRTNSDGGQ